MLPWFDLVLLYTNHTHMQRDHWRKGESLERVCRCTATAVPLPLYCCRCTAVAVLYIEIVTAKLSGCFYEKKTALLDRFVCL